EDRAGDRFPEPLAGQELDRALTAIELAADAAAEPRHHASFAVADLAVAGRAGLAGARGPPRQGARAPRRTRSSPDSGWPPPKNLVLAGSVLTRWVNVNATINSVHGGGP